MQRMRARHLCKTMLVESPMMLFVKFLIGSLVYGLVIGAALKLNIWIKDRGHLVDEKPGFFATGLAFGWIVGLYGVPFFLLLSLFVSSDYLGRFMGDDISVLIAITGGLPVYYFYRGLRKVLLGDHDMEGIDHLVEVPNSALAGLFILGVALLPVWAGKSPVDGDLIKGAFKMFSVVSFYLIAVLVVDGIKWVIVRLGFEDLYLAWGRFSWKVLGAALVASYYAYIIGATNDSGFIGVLSSMFFRIIQGTTNAYLGFFW